jgi:hypothetical protein
VRSNKDSLYSFQLVFSASDPITRKKYVRLVEAVQQKGGEVVIFSSMHESGQRMCSSHDIRLFSEINDPLRTESTYGTRCNPDLSAGH